jgi:hypothetical protein
MIYKGLLSHVLRLFKKDWTLKQNDIWTILSGYYDLEVATLQVFCPPT